MKAAVPWSIRGIDDDIREAARMAARRSGVTVSEWLNELIAKQAAAEGAAPDRPRERPKASAAPARAKADPLEELTRRLAAMDENARASLLDLRERLDQIEDRLVAERERESEGRWRDPEARSGREEERSEGDLGLVADAIRNLDARISSMSGEIEPPDEEAPADINALRSRLDALLARAPEPAAQGRAAALDATLRSLESHLDEARGRLEGTAAQSRPATRGRDQLENDLAAAVAEIAARQRAIDEEREEPREEAADRGMLAVMRDELDALRRAVEGETGLNHIAASLNRVLDRTPEPARLAEWEKEIAAIRRLLGAADGSRAIGRLEMRVAELARGMEAALNATNAAARRTDPEAITRIEQRLEKIGGRIDEFLRQSAPADTLKAIHERLANIAERVDRLRAERANPMAGFEAVKSEIAAMRGEIARHAPPKIDHLEAQLTELARRLDAVARADAGRRGISELEAQVAGLAAELERSTPRTATLRQVEENLARLQEFISGNREESVEAARSAARDAVREMADASGDSDLVRALKEDLRNIRAAAGDADQQTQAKLGSVQDTLARIVERLARLETENAAAASRAIPEVLPATGTYGGGPIPRAGETGLALRDWAGAERLSGDNRPLEPGSGKPDIAALRELARSAADPSRRGDRKADFIAAARRAAQAAAAEAAMEERQAAAEEARPGAFNRIGQAIRTRKRPLLLAAAALVLAISAIRLFGEPGEEPAQRKAELVVEEPKTPLPAATPLPGAAAALAVSAPAIAFAPPAEINTHFGDGTLAPPTNAFAAHERQPMAEAAPSQLEADPPVIAEAARDNPPAAFDMARRHARAKDFAQAAEWYQRAAEAGMAVAQFRLANLYEHGTGVAKDREMAARWYQRAADQGHVGAMHNLAVMMSDGVDGQPNRDKAFQWFRAAANYGVADSQYNLGIIYARGPDRDLVEAYKWFAIVAAGGDAEAAARRDEVAAALGPDELIRARAAVQAWRPTPVIAEANTVPAPVDLAGGVTEHDRRALVRKIQTLLAGQGYDPGPPDGFAGPKTRQAVRAFQRSTGASQTGVIGAELLAALAAGPN